MSIQFEKRFPDLRLEAERAERICCGGGVTQHAASVYLDVTGREARIIDEPQPITTLTRAEVLLASIIKIAIVGCMGAYGSDGVDTYDLVSAIEPDLCAVVGADRVRELCRNVHRAEDAGLSEWYTATFYKFNKTYFNSSIEDFSVRVVYDIFPWIGITPNRGFPAHTDLARRRIILRMAYGYNLDQMDALLLHHMAHAKTKTTNDDAEAWRREVKRLEEAGLEVFLNGTARER